MIGIKDVSKIGAIQRQNMGKGVSIKELEIIREKVLNKQFDAAKIR